jgi:hypothetical protein
MISTSLIKFDIKEFLTDPVKGLFKDSVDYGNEINAMVVGIVEDLSVEILNGNVTELFCLSVNAFAALLIAIKFYCPDALSISELLLYTGSTIRRPELLQAERDILKLINYNLLKYL